ncbi:sugar phosphate isomerase/epimerase family protein [Kitasatospora sp. NPDC092948]|uniref:sugar phosphate isomerase/epimerase family protein n=1 Tax=Kitasatospora sp. NPDC092948 TaxID=3364088 RepID=UPI0038125C07
MTDSAPQSAGTASAAPLDPPPSDPPPLKPPPLGPPPLRASTRPLPHSLSRAPAPTLSRPFGDRLPGPTISFGGIGDEAAPDLPGQLDALNELGWHDLELRTVDGRWIAELPLDRVRRIAETLAARGTRVTGLASRIGNWASRITDDFDRDLAELSALAVRAALLGTDRIRVMSYPNAELSEATWRRRALERLTRLAELADRNGLTLLHENCSGWAGTCAERQLDLVTTVDSPALRLLFDAGNGVPHGYDGYSMLREVVDHVAHVHIKDAVGGGHRTEYVLPGEGVARLAESLRFLVDRGWSGGWSLEPHLATRPHHGLAADGTAVSGFVAAGRALGALVETEILPSAAGWRSVPGGLECSAAVSHEQ